MLGVVWDTEGRSDVHVQVVWGHSTRDKWPGALAGKAFQRKGHWSWVLEDEWFTRQNFVESLWGQLLLRAGLNRVLLGTGKR